ncbi:hypothetical protein [Sphingomonas sp.]|jgi:hypothetical protein|uniref:hypothetical protein n=1 Tax=Sphingomonas sp. TaxID=28214 RepID=UPI002E2F68EF|nr:hypothetical protein [Sphingomonas sp.]HEX4694348.1 hypothetical protein [Sphingomonas sp.]
MRQYLVFAALGLIAAAPAVAQTTGPGTAPSTAAANRRAADAIDARDSARADANAAVAADAQSQYSRDLAAYDSAVRARHAATMRDRMHYNHQRRAYAMAMEAWRAQVAACRRGHRRACNAPSPNPAAFW